MTEAPVQLGIKEVEELVGKKAIRVDVRDRDIVLHFTSMGMESGCPLGPHEGSSGADLQWRIRRW
jgi:hypothetical protein